MKDCIEHQKAEFSDVAFPMLLPTIVLAHEMNGIQCSGMLLSEIEKIISQQDNS